MRYIPKAPERARRHKLTGMTSSPPTDDPATEMPPAATGETNVLLNGTLHVYVAFDWGDEVDLDHVRSLTPAEVRNLPRRRRTPVSIAYNPPPLRFVLAAPPLDLAELEPVSVRVEATVFDFAAVSVALHVPFRLTTGGLSRLAGRLTEPGYWVRAARKALEPLHEKLLPAVRDPLWREELSEEYFVFQLLPDEPLQAATVRERQAGWLAGLVRLDTEPLSADEVAEALRLYLSYYPRDLFVPDWAAAFLIDADCDETLQTIEFANLQLLEYRHIDSRLDSSLAVAYRSIQQVQASRLAFLRGSHQPLQSLGELKVEATGLFERTGNVLKLVGDQYLARIYRLVATRFHLREWERSIQRKLDVAEGIYEILAGQAAGYRMEFLEVIVIGLIVLEIILALVHH